MIFASSTQDASSNKILASNCFTASLQQYNGNTMRNAESFHAFIGFIANAIKADETQGQAFAGTEQDRAIQQPYFGEFNRVGGTTGTACTAVASNTGDPRFKSHNQKI